MLWLSEQNATFPLKCINVDKFSSAWLSGDFMSDSTCCVASETCFCSWLCCWVDFGFCFFVSFTVINIVTLTLLLCNKVMMWLLCSGSWVLEWCTHACMHTCTHKDMCTQAHTRAHTHANTHTPTHTHKLSLFLDWSQFGKEKKCAGTSDKMLTQEYKV